VSVALTRAMLWRMLGASHPMEGHRLDSRAIWLRGKSDERKGGRGGLPRKARADFPDRVSTDLPHIAPWMERSGLELILPELARGGGTVRSVVEEQTRHSPCGRPLHRCAVPLPVPGRIA